MMIFFRENESFQNEINLKPEEVEHLKSLRIFNIAKELEFRDGNGNSFFFQVESQSKKGRLLRKETFSNTEASIEIASAIPKSDRLDFLLQKGTEIGVTRFIFLNFLHSERKDYNEERSKKIIREAASQSRRHFFPRIEKFNKPIALFATEKNFFYLDPGARNKISEENIKNRIPIIGPEGGFREEEISLFEKSNIEGFSMGENILRIETAFLYMASVLKYLSGVR